MTPYSQKDGRWSGLYIGNSKLKIGPWGCALTCGAILSDKAPNELNELMRKNGGFTKDGLVLWDVMARLLNLNWNPDRTKKIGPIALAVTNHYFPGTPQHFYVHLADGTIIDPVDGKVKKNPYNVIGWRNLSPKFVNPPVNNQGGYMQIPPDDILFYIAKSFWAYFYGEGVPAPSDQEVRDKMAHIKGIMQAQNYSFTNALHQVYKETKLG